MYYYYSTFGRLVRRQPESRVAVISHSVILTSNLGLAHAGPSRSESSSAEPSIEHVAVTVVVRKESVSPRPENAGLPSDR